MERSIVLYFSIGAVLNQFILHVQLCSALQFEVFQQSGFDIKMLSVILSKLLGGAYGKEGSASCYADYT